MSAQKILSIGEFNTFARYLRLMDKVLWVHQCEAPPEHEDESTVQVRLKLVSTSPIDAEKTSQWTNLDHTLVASIWRVDGKAFGGRIRSFEVKDRFLYMDVQLLNILCADAPGEGDLPHERKPLWFKMKGRRLGVIGPLPMMKILQPV